VGFDGNAGFSQPITGNEGTLLIPAIQSPNFQEGESGWEISADGSAEFNDATIRGSILEDGTYLGYYGTPGAGTLFVSISPTGGIDKYGNAYDQGVDVFDPFGSSEPFFSAIIYSDVDETIVVINGLVAWGTVTGANPAGAQESWHAPTYKNGYSDFGSSHQTVRYAMDATQRVWLDGDAKPGTWTNGTILFTLPTGYAPKALRSYLRPSANLSGDSYSIDVDSSGNVKVNDIVGSAPAIITLSDISWPTT
jgi:hypothetical protein